MRQEHYSNYPFNTAVLHKQAVYECCDVMEQMASSPSVAVQGYLQNKGYNRAVTQEAAQLYVYSQTKGPSPECKR